MSWKLTKEFTFEASHVLPDHKGKCSRLHGHSWKARVVFQGDQLQESGSETGMLLDFNVVKLYMNPMVEHFLDHYHLNDSLGIYPTSENVARWIYNKLMLVMPQPYASLLRAVEIAETCTSAVVYENTDY